MKRIIAIILILFVVGIADSPRAKKFEVIFTIKYNAITLEDAAKKEMVFRELYKDACIVDVKVKESGITFTTDGIGHITLELLTDDDIGADDIATSSIIWNLLK